MIGQTTASILIFFPHEPFSVSRVDSEFASEYEAAKTVGFTTGFYDHDVLEQGDLKTALKPLPFSENKQRLILRGWMIPGEIYTSLFEALQSKGYKPETTPEAYEEAHYIPHSYPHTKEQTSRCSWIYGDNVNAAWELYSEFSNSNAIIKDWVKSAKSRWNDGCFIPANTNEKRFREIYKVFREERGNLFNRGIVLREFMPIIEHGKDMRGMPIVEETRLFFWNGSLIVPPKPSDPSPLDNCNQWEQIARKFKSPFITIDVAYLTDGTWKIVEVGDGGVSGLPLDLTPDRFYKCLWEHTNNQV
ncbi:ATP-grasp domain-containing protein [Gimesia aquarii]|uniref:ATP-grasp domain-containing protein n=1 Tax=Gimesia aquarii TaxID=2527964 RepID=A0A517W249_9PLAN|nr:ATP-grasp domain-containing protein [Gimesia aquarii]QDT99343.1 hypothetical protein V144x_48540 [Gimesia aquarii]